MSKHTSFLCINNNDDVDKPTEELKQVEVVKTKPLAPPPVPGIAYASAQSSYNFMSSGSPV
jgi:hypothetical protein